MSIESQFDPEERRLEAMMDGSGFSRDRAEIKLGKKVVSGATELPATPPRERKRRQTGNVRDYESDRDHQLAEERAAYQPLTEEQREINARGSALLRKEMGDLPIQNIIDDVNRLIPIDPDNVAKSEAARERMINARLRTYFDRRK